MSFELVPFETIFKSPQKNGLNKPKRVRGQGLPMVNMGEIFEHRRIKNIEMDLVPVIGKELEYVLEDDDLLFARQSLVLSGAGKCSIFLKNNQPTVFESHLIRCRLDKNKADPHFYFYYFQSKQGRDLISTIVEQGAGASGIRASDLVKLNVPLCDVRQQEKISSILRALDDKIDLLKDINKNLESIAQTIFKSWFVNFDPVRAKQQGVECAGVDKATADLFPNSFVESELGLIPKGWTTKQLKDIAVRHVEKIKNVVDWENEYLIDLSRIDSKTLFNINNGFGKELTTSVTKFAKGDILFGAIRPYFHKVTIANLNGVTNISVFVIRPSVDFYHEYLANLMFNESTVNFSVRLSKGTKMPVISWSDLSTLKITLAPESIIKKYSELISPLMKKGIENSALINSLTSIRDTLLPRLISCKLDLSNIEEQIEGVA